MISLIRKKGFFAVYTATMKPLTTLLLCLSILTSVNAKVTDVTNPGALTGKKNLVISLSGAGVYGNLLVSKGIDIATGNIGYLVSAIQGKSWSSTEVSNAKNTDKITEIANCFASDRTAAITGYPWLFGGDSQIPIRGDIGCQWENQQVCVPNTWTINFGFFKIPIQLGNTCYDVYAPVLGTCTIDLKFSQLDDTWWGPKPNDFASTIQSYLSQMVDNPRLILIGKSMGGCLLWKTAQNLLNLGVKVDMLILVDASCTIDFHDNTTITIPANVENVINLREDNHRNNSQTGYRVSFYHQGHDIVVNNYDAYLKKTLCSTDVVHDNIDECQGVQDLIKQIVTARINGDGIPVILDILMNN